MSTTPPPGPGDVAPTLQPPTAVPQAPAGAPPRWASPPPSGTGGTPPPSDVADDRQKLLIQSGVAVLGLVLITIVAGIAIGLDSSNAGTVAGAAFTALATVISAFLGLKATGDQAQRTQQQAQEATRQANTATIMAAHLPDARAARALADAGLIAPTDLGDSSAR